MEEDKKEIVKESKEKKYYSALDPLRVEYDKPISAVEEVINAFCWLPCLIAIPITYILYVNLRNDPNGGLIVLIFPLIFLIPMVIAISISYILFLIKDSIKRIIISKNSKDPNQIKSSKENIIILIAVFIGIIVLSYIDPAFQILSEDFLEFFRSIFGIIFGTISIT